MSINKLVIVRHGESCWNKEGRFTGWHDVDLSDKGCIEAKNVGNLLKKEGMHFHYAYTSVLKRAIHTLWNILYELDQTWIPVEKTWRLNERHYGALQGLNKADTIAKYGENQVKRWRRSFHCVPPHMDRNDDCFPKYDIRYQRLTDTELPTSESLAMTVDRIIPLWNGSILPRIKQGEQVIIVAHGNSLRALIKYISNISETDIVQLDIPTGMPWIYEFDENFKPITHYYLQDNK
ncbi:2,3-diphosphoglycerate-dependent phosphoglycerate mutase [Candidatus Pantoea carbekii]|uniref:2,3-bisphosphoglycerate-dependent phosphoglycerate mutase n=1 Tax=Candidatus Pantoea carbekii TaxID=1235990 RepID=U3U8L6_9GAMM|nr:2,3-diphosphoglycerate-dependent phosphoglycerate mutase [Candidatus Pantoea carbekii]AKC32186.1 phosphoglyceromutase GpmA [Candidatus Pantoea carbekii]BAO00714.1 GpmA protein [Candidatus Pantoea carbekii]